MKRIILILIVLSILSCSSKTIPKINSKNSLDGLITNVKTSDDWVFKTVEKSKLLFSNGKTFETNLFDLEYIGKIQTENKAPYLIFSGRDCEECDANISIYIHSPSDGKIIVENGQNRYNYPGKEIDYETNSVVYTSRAFYGQVLEKVFGVIWYESLLLENGKISNDVFLSHIDNGLKRDTIFKNNGELNETLNLKKRGLCKEIKGQEFKSEP